MLKAPIVEKDEKQETHMNWIVRITYVMALALASPALAQNQTAPGMRSVKIEVSDFQKSIDSTARSA